MAACGACAAAGDARGRVSQLCFTRALPAGVRLSKGLNEKGFVEGRNVVIEYRWAEGHDERLPAFIADLVQREVNVIAATSTPATVAAKAANTTIPTVFTTGGNPVQLGFVTSRSKPGGNLTGATTLNEEVVPKRLELMHEVLPTAINIALLVNPRDPLAEQISRDMRAPAAALGLTPCCTRQQGAGLGCSL